MALPPCSHGMPSRKSCIECMEEGPVEETKQKKPATRVMRARYEGTCAIDRSHTISVGDFIGDVEGHGWACERCCK